MPSDPATPATPDRVLDVTGLHVAYGDTVAVDGVDLQVDAGEVVALLGPSGCGKSSLLRAVAGLEPGAGRVVLDGRELTGIPPHQRGVGLMFQGDALFPHRDVGANVAFGLRMQGWARQEVTDRVAWALQLVGLPGTRGRAVDTLSGGEQQRVALARAIAPRPRLLMLDEPLSSVDRALRDRLLEELPAVFDEVDAAVVYVTHDQSEALALADRVVLMRAGRIVQQGPPPQVWARPASRFVAQFLGLRPVLDATVDDEVATTAFGSVAAPGRPDGPATVVVPPGAVAPRSEAGWAARGTVVPVDTTVAARRFAGDHVVVVGRTDDGTTFEVAWRGGDWPAIGAPLPLTLDLGALVVVAAD